jgi:transcriptional regulator with XRE-family HTH domain
MSYSGVINMFAYNLKELMKEKNMSEYELAAKSGITVFAIDQILCKNRAPRLQDIVNIRFALDCDYDDLIPFTNGLV